MSQLAKSKLYVVSPGNAPGDEPVRFDLEKAAAALGIDLRSPEALAASLPFGLSDVTMGCENELRTRTGFYSPKTANSWSGSRSVIS